MAFKDELRAAQNEFNIRGDNIDAYKRLTAQYAKDYAKSNKEDTSAEARAILNLSRFVQGAGAIEGALSKDSTEDEIAEYGGKLLADYAPDYNMSFSDYIRAYGTDKQKTAYGKLQNTKNIEQAKALNSVLRDTAMSVPPIVGGAMGGLPGLGLGALVSLIGGSAYKKDADKRIDDEIEDAKKTVEEAEKSYKDMQKYSKGEMANLINNYQAILENVTAAREKAAASEDEAGTETEANGEDSDNSDSNSNSDSSSNSGSNSGSNSNSDDETTSEDVVLNIKKGDTFGQMLLDAGIVTDNGLWGPNGDVEFYTKQLSDPYHMNLIYPGQAIRLKRRRNR